MNTDTAALRTYFAKLGLAAEFADIYLALHTHGPQTISQLSRTASVERTRLYRLLDDLTKSNLIEIEAHHQHGLIKAAPIANLHILINQKEQELKGLQDELSLIAQVLTQNSLSSPATRIQSYHGAEGLRQMRWNALKARSDIIGYAYRIHDEGTQRDFMERWADEFERRGLHSRTLVGDDFVRSWAENQPKVRLQRRIKGMQYHYIDPNVFKIAHSCSVYDNVTSYFNWKDGDIFGIEIYNQDIATAQAQTFELLWAKSTPESRF